MAEAHVDMITGFKITKNYAIDFGLLYKVREFKDGITFFELISNLDIYKADHNPKMSFRLIFFNVVIFDICIYNIHHIYDHSY